jgi:hypothetical protein
MLPAFFNIVGYQAKKVSADSNVATHRTVMDAGDRYVTKTHPALDPIEMPDFSAWVKKINSHEGGMMPTEVVHGNRPVDQEAAAARAAENICDDPEIKAMFDELGAPMGKRIATARKHGSVEATTLALKTAVFEKRAKDDEKKAKKEAK